MKPINYETTVKATSGVILMAVLKLEHTGIMVKSMDASVQFYQTVLGMELKGILQHNAPEIKLGFLGFHGDDGCVVELVEGFKSGLPSEGTVHHLAFTVDDVEKETERLKSLGVKLLDNGITTLRNGARYIFFEGPDGEQLELFQPAGK